jgi:outer membrane protein W
MKKYLTIILAAALTGILPADDFSLSVGAGAHIGGLFTRYTLSANGSIEGEAVNVNAAQTMNQFNFGSCLFFDATWIEFSVGVQSGLNNYEETMIAASPSIDDITTTSRGKGSEVMFSLALFGKYPFTLNEKFTLFPLAGLEYQITLMQSRQPEGRRQYDRTDPERGETDANGKTYALPVWNSLFIVVGGGMDYQLSSSMFIRTELLYGFRLQTFYEIDALEKARKGVNAQDPKLGGLTSGPTLRIAAGWRFN